MSLRYVGSHPPYRTILTAVTAVRECPHRGDGERPNVKRGVHETEKTNITLNGFSLEMRCKENGQSHYNTGNVHQILSDTSYCFIGKFSSTGSLLISHFLDCITESLQQ